MNQKRAQLIVLMMIVVFLITGMKLEAKGEVSSKIIQTGGIHVIEFTMTAGKVYINLPDDMMTGDQISGKLTIWPSGKSLKKKAKNLKILQKFKMTVDGKLTQPGSEWDKWIIKSKNNISVKLLSPNGKPVSAVRIPVIKTITTVGAITKATPEACMAGGMFSFKGKFDGDFSNTKASINGSALVKWAESPRRLILASPGNAAGQFVVSVQEGSTLMTSSIRNLALETRIGKKRLLKGETTTLEVTVKGLEGLTKKIPLRLVNNTPSIVSLKETEIFYIDPTGLTLGTFSFKRILTGITPGNFHISVTIPKQKNDCDEILQEYNEVKSTFDKQDKDCRELQKLVDKLRGERDTAKGKRDNLKNNLEKTKKELKNEKDKIDEAKKKLKKLIDDALHVDGISSEPQPGLDNFVGLGGSEVGIYFTGSQRSIDVVSWFLNEYREKWSKLRREIRDSKNRLKDLEKEKVKTEKDLNNAEKELKDAEKKLSDAEARLKECLKGKAALDNQLKDLKDKYNKCLERIEAGRICKGNIDDAAGSIARAKDEKKSAEGQINRAAEGIKELEDGSGKSVTHLDDAKKLQEESDILRKKAEETLERAKKAYERGNFESANKLANEAKKLGNEATRKAKNASSKAKQAQREVDLKRKQERKAEERKKRDEERKKELKRKEMEWWDRFLSEPDPDPHDINGGSRNLAIGLSDVIDNHILDLISGAKFGDKKTLCKDKCLIAVKNTFGKEWRNILNDMAWDVFLGSMALPATITKTSTKLSFSVFKTMVGKLIKSDNAIPLWGKYTYEHEQRGFKHMSVGKFKCEIESFLVYNKETGYVMGMILCNCCGKTTTLYIKYRVDENGRALKRPHSRIEFR